MKKLTLIITCIYLAGCHKADHNVATSIDHTAGIVKSRTWSGYNKGSYQNNSSAAGSYNNPVTDTMFAVNKISDTSINAPGGSLMLVYKTTDSAKQVVTFTYNQSLTTATLSYYYAADSVTYSYSALSQGMYGMDDPYETTTYLYSHH